jgi:lysophospholipase L1-like esterase
MNSAIGHLVRALRRYWGVVAALSVLLVAGAVLAFTSVAGVDDFAPADGPAHTQSALFIGDSYTEGPDTPDVSYGCMTAAALGWKCDIAAQGGTGYLSGGPGHRVQLGQSAPPSTSFVERLPRLRDLYQPDIVVIDGGRNDDQFDISDVDRTFAYTVRKVIETWPKARIAVIAPWYVNEPVMRPPGLGGRTIGDEFRSVLSSSRDFDAVDFIDPGALGWFAGIDTSPYLSDDGIHPNSEGVKKIAELLTQAFRNQGFANRS